MPFTVTMPKLSPTMEEGTIAKWHKNEGEYVEAGALLVEVTTDKATVEYTALDEGWLRKILLHEGETANVNTPLALFTVEENESIEEQAPQKPSEKAEEKIAPDEAPPQPPPPSSTIKQPTFVPEAPLDHIPTVEPEFRERIHASPLARTLAKQKGLDLTTVTGSGPGGRIVSKDLNQAQPAQLVTFGRHEAPTVAAGTYEELPLTPMRKTIGRRLQESKSFIPHFYVKQIIDAEPLVTMRTQLKALELHVTYNDMIIRACALALRQHPGVNTGFNNVNQTVIQFKTIDISVAVTIEAGLITPIIRHADYKHLGHISLEVRALAKRAQTGKLKEHEYKGGSFCVSNLGMYGITEFSAVINPPQSAILAIGGIESQPVIKEGLIVHGKRMTLTLSADHRVVDGALAAHFLKTVQHLLENPVSLVL